VRKDVFFILQSSPLADTMNRFTPTLLWEERVTASELIQERFNESLSIGTRMDVTLLPEENCLVWLKISCGTIVKLKDQYRDRASSAIEYWRKSCLLQRFPQQLRLACSKFLFASHWR
jgi:hypothetical protein